MRSTLPDDLVVVSPHLDDAVLSLGAAIARATRAGRRVTVLTVFAGDPGSAKTAGGWDRRGGFETEGDAARARGLEDRSACGLLGAKPVWLPFSEADYRNSFDEEGVLLGVRGEAQHAKALLVPGFPLTNPDHAWLADVLVRRRPYGVRVGLYAEQPYRYWAQGMERRLGLPSVLATSASLADGWTRLGLTLRSLRAKRKAILEYDSQLPLLGLQRGCPSQLDRLLAREALARGEAIAWLA
jgi:LmbE family N-acetylglucosaminyl deacetylase